MNVIMFHSVGQESSDWNRSYLSVPVTQLEYFFRYLRKHNYATWFMDDWYSCRKPHQRLTRDIVLTFDDGYLDNWVFLFPLLKKYNIKATIFVNPGFVDPSLDQRKTLLDVWNGNLAISDLSPLGFLNWAEIVAMQKSGLVDIQSHSMTHDWVFSSNSLIDVYSKQPDYDWISWLLYPNQKYQYISDPSVSTRTPIGYPVFEFGRALGVRKYNPSLELIKFASQQAERFHDSSIAVFDTDAIIKRIVEYGKRNSFGEYETEKEQIERYWYELSKAKEILECRLDKPVDYLCWPGGGYNQISVSMSWDAGYKASTIASWDTKTIPDNSGPNKRIKRFSCSHKISVRDTHYYLMKRSIMARSLRATSGSYMDLMILRAVKAFVSFKEYCT